MISPPRGARVRTEKQPALELQTGPIAKKGRKSKECMPNKKPPFFKMGASVLLKGCKRNSGFKRSLFAGLIFWRTVVLFLVWLPDRKAATVRESGLNAHFGQYPLVEDVPDGEDAENAEYFHKLPPYNSIFNIVY